jgi:prepilin-type N-terminal cleavage/methylation domain-containing protein
MTFRQRKSQKGFTLLEIMAAVTLLALIFTTVMQIRSGAMEKAAHARALSIASRLGQTLLHQIEIGNIDDLIDGYSGDFSEQGFGEFKYVIGIGDDSQFSGSNLSDIENVWRDYRRNETSNNGDETESSTFPEHTRVFINISFPSFKNDQDLEEYKIESMVNTWAVERNFELYYAIWPELNPEIIE